MKNKKKNLIIGVFLNCFLILSLIVPIIYLYETPKSNIFEVKNNRAIVKASDIFDTLNFTLQNLWSVENQAFYYYQKEDGSFDEIGKKFFTSFNAWSYFAMLEVSKMTNNFSYFYNYSIPCLDYIMTHLINKTNYRVYHWCFNNGSLPPIVDISNYNFSTETYPNYQSWTILALLSAYNLTGNITYLNDYAIPMLNFLITTLWDADNNSFYSCYYFNGAIDFVKDSWYQEWAIIALLEAYEITDNITYIEYANKTLNFLLNYLWDQTYGGFYSFCEKNGSNPLTSKYIASQAAGISAITKMVLITNNFSLINDIITPTLNFTFLYLWKNEYGQFINSTNRFGETQDIIIRPSDISILLKALLEIPANFNLTSYTNYILNSVDQLLTKIRDDKAFCREYNLSSGIIYFDKWTIEQALPLLMLSELYNVSQNYLIFKNILILPQEKISIFYIKIINIICSINTLTIIDLYILKNLDILIQKPLIKYKAKKKKGNFIRKKISKKNN